MISTPFVAVPPPAYGGTELVVSELVEGLAQAGHPVTLFATGDSRVSASLRARLPRAAWPPEPYLELSHAAWAVGQIIAESERYDVVHAHIPAAVALAPFVGLPMIHTLHHERDRALERYYRQHQDEVLHVAISRRQREILDGVAASAPVVHHGLDPARYPVGPGGPGVVFLGRLAREKGPAAAIDVARAAGVPIRVAGKAHWRDQRYYQVEVAPRLTLPSVEYVGEVGHVEKCALLGQARALLCPIAWDEPFGLVLIESMLCGTPVLAFGRGAVPEIIDPGVTGFVAGDLDEMARLLRDRIPTLDRAACARRARERFSRARMVADYLRVYERAALRRPGAGQGVSTQPRDREDEPLART